MVGAAGAAGVVTRRVRIYGRVQGVGFRFSAARRALALGVNGRIRNLGDGTVEVIVAGAAPAVESLLAWLRHGPPMAEVSAIQVEDAAGLSVPPGFSTH